MTVKALLMKMSEEVGETHESVGKAEGLAGCIKRVNETPLSEVTSKEVRTIAELRRLRAAHPVDPTSLTKIKDLNKQHQR